MKTRDPIYYVNLLGYIKAVKSKKIEIIKINEIVAKGTVEQIKKSNTVKKRFLRAHFKSYKKIKEFNFNRLTIVEVEIIKFLGHGIKQK